METCPKIRLICLELYKNPFNIDRLRELKSILKNSESNIVRYCEKQLFGVFYNFMQVIAKDRDKFSQNHKEIIVECLTTVLNNISASNLTVFFNFHLFLTYELYDFRENRLVLDSSEEYKTCLLRCISTLIRGISDELVFQVYSHNNVSKLAPIVHSCCQIVREEKSRNLRCLAIECLMVFACVDDIQLGRSDDVVDDHIAQVFIYFLPGVACCLRDIALSDFNKENHKIPMMALRALTRIIRLTMRDYNSIDDKIDLRTAKTEPKLSIEAQKARLAPLKRTQNWYKENDANLERIISKLLKLCNHNHVNVKSELIRLIEGVTSSCFNTMPKSFATLLEIAVILSQDTDVTISKPTQRILSDISMKLNELNCIQSVFEHFEARWVTDLEKLPRIFHGIDDQDKLAAVNLLNGYFSLFGSAYLRNILLNAYALHVLTCSLLNICELERNFVSTIEEYTIVDISDDENSRKLETSWCVFRNFRHADVKIKIMEFCGLFAHNADTMLILTSKLLENIIYSTEHRKESIFLLNSIIQVVNPIQDECKTIVVDILDSYLEYNADLPVNLITNNIEYTLNEIQDNIVTICLVTEGIGKMAQVLRDDFRNYLLKTLYFVLEKAGSHHPLIRDAGLKTLHTVIRSCNYRSITELINDNIDLFTYLIERRLIRINDSRNNGVFNVISVILKQSDVTVLPYIRHIIEEILVQSCDNHHCYSNNTRLDFLKTFKTFLETLSRWYNVSQLRDNGDVVKSKIDIQNEYYPDFKVTGIETEDSLPDDETIDTSKTVEEMYKEDMEGRQCEEYAEQGLGGALPKPDAPTHIKLCVGILKRTLNFLPSKDRNLQLLTLEILTVGMEIIKDYEDELLPMTHEIWSPLVPRFRSGENHAVIILFCFRLLKALARLTRDFIRSRTIKDVLPNLCSLLEQSLKNSSGKDRGASYRYTQEYKLQFEVISEVGYILMYINADKDGFEVCSNVVVKYLSQNQPKPLQAAAVDFYKIMAKYDPELVNVVLEIQDSDLSENIKCLKNVLNKN